MLYHVYLEPLLFRQRVAVVHLLTVPRASPKHLFLLLLTRQPLHLGIILDDPRRQLILLHQARFALGVSRLLPPAVQVHALEEEGFCCGAAGKATAGGGRYVPNASGRPRRNTGCRRTGTASRQLEDGAGFGWGISEPAQGRGDTGEGRRRPPTARCAWLEEPHEEPEVFR